MIRQMERRHGACWLLAALFAMLAMPSMAQTSDWVYRVRPHDNIWDLTSRYLNPDVSWQKLQDYNKVADPLHLPPGMSLRVPIAWLRMQPAQATVVAVIGSAHVRDQAQAQPVAVAAGMSVGYGAQLTTDANASLTLQFADGSRVLMQSQSELDLDRLSAYGRTGMVDTRLRLQRGRVSSDVTPLSGTAAHFSIETPGAISSVRGTHFRVAADGDTQSSQTEVTKGRVDVAGAKRHVMVNTGRGVAVADGQHPGQIHPLLAAPELHCPQQPVSHLPYNLTWKPLDGAQRYRVQVAPNARFEALLEDRVLDAPQLSLPDLPDGEHALRVRGIDAQKLEGEDATCSFTVGAHPQPPLVMEPLPGGKVRDTRPRFRWTESEEAASYAWQLASDTDFSHVLADQPTVKGGDVRVPQALPLGRYYWRVATRDSNGKLGPYTDAQAFDLVQQLPVPEVGKPKHSSHQLDFAWQSGLPGQHYHIQLAKQKDFAHPLVDQTVEQPALQINKPGSGIWYLRVQTIDTDGYAGPWSPAQKIKLPCIACRIAIGGGGAVLLWLVL